MQSKQQSLERFKVVRLLLSIYRIRAVRAIFPIAIIALVYWEGQHELKQIHLGLILRELRRLPNFAIFQMMGFALLAVAIMSTYDYLIRAHFRLRVGLWSTFRYAWIANTFNNLIGFAGLAGVGLRTLLYKKSGVPASVLTPAIVFLSPLMITGLSVLSWANIFGLLPASALLEEHHWLVFAIWGMALYLPIFVFVQRSSLYAKWINQGKGRTPWLTVVASVGASFLEWSFAGVTFWTISSHLLDEIHFLAIFGIFTVAAIAGILSMAPGGIGAFDLIALLGLTQLGFKSDQAMAVLVIFRLFYYVIPWLIGLVLAALEIGLQGKKGLDRAASSIEPSLNGWQRIWSNPSPYSFLSDLGIWALGKLVFASGLLLLLSTATPGLLYRLRMIEELLTFPVMQLSHYLSVFIGFILILLSRGITQRVYSAYLWTSIFLFSGTVFALTKGFDYEEALFMLLVGILLWISRSHFYRISAPVSRKSTIGWIALTSWIAFSYYLMGSYVHRGFLKHLPHGVEPEWLQRHSHIAFTAVGGLIFSWIFHILLVTQRLHSKADMPFESLNVTQLESFLSRAHGNTLTHLFFLGDKSFFWAQNSMVLFGFSCIGDKLVVMGDPLGERSLMNEAISEFRLAADKYGLVVVFYQVTTAFSSVYREHGYRLLELGEEAWVTLDSFTLDDPQYRDLLNISNLFEQEGYVFEMVEAPHPEGLLHAIAEDWPELNEFDLQLAPIAMLRDDKGKVIACASITPGYDQGQTFSIDLIRYQKGASGEVCDYLCIRLLEWAKSEGYRRCSLGMAPMSRGTCQAQERFNPEWEPRYLAYPASLALPSLRLDLVKLLSRHPAYHLDK